MKLVALIMCALCAGMALMCAIEGNSFAAGFNLFASILNAGNFIHYICKQDA
jgi:hypothetical protein